MQPGNPDEVSASQNNLPAERNRWTRERRIWIILILVAFLLGNLSGYGLWGRSAPAPESSPDRAGDTDLAALVEQVIPPDGYQLPIRYGDLGPRLLAAGAIDYNAFMRVFEAAGHPLTKAQLEILTRGSNQQIIINAKNAHFLLNFFWAVGLVNSNPILTEGPITQYSDGQIERFASTGGWTIGAKPVTERFASVPLVSLTLEQQARLKEVAQAVYRPCCDNPTHFPDCNHGMAMLGVLELMASQDASVDEMFEAAKYVNAYWFPQQTLETALFLKANQGWDFEDIDPRLIVGAQFSSGSGFAQVHQWLQVNGLLERAPRDGDSCGA